VARASVNGGHLGSGFGLAALTWGAFDSLFEVKAPHVDVGRVDLAWRGEPAPDERHRNPTRPLNDSR
jgi:hypothetical protein